MLCRFFWLYFEYLLTVDFRRVDCGRRSWSSQELLDLALAPDVVREEIAVDAKLFVTNAERRPKEIDEERHHGRVRVTELH